MKKIFFVFAALLVAAPALFGQTKSVDENYRRSSIYSIMVSHDQEKYHTEIEDVFQTIPVPDKFDDHDLSVKVVTSSSKKVNEAEVTSFLKANNVARHMVGRWFNRDPQTGECDMNLIIHRGLYDATYFDVELAKMSQRGYGMLSDAGEELIGNTFVIVNDIWYNDRNKGARVAGAIFSVLGSIADAVLGTNGFSDLGDSLNALLSDLQGFGVHIVTYLYRLEWNDDIANDFYTRHYIAPGEVNQAKINDFNSYDGYSLKYIGKQESISGNLTLAGLNYYDPSAVMTKVCTRAIDESVVKLQKKYEEFKIKTPLFSVEPLTAKIGMKEGVTEKCRYEVLEPVIDENGRTSYKRVGVIAPVGGKIWDNRYMAVEEKAEGSNLTETTFKKVSGGNFYPGMLIREISVK